MKNLVNILIFLHLLAAANADVLDDLAAKVVRKACSKGVYSSCVELANYYTDLEEYAKAKKYYNIACDAGELTGCALLADLELAEDEPDYAKAYELAESACLQNSAAACQVLATMYHFGLGLAVDLERAKELYQSACAANDADACYYLGVLHDASSEGAAHLAPDDAQAFGYYEKSCLRAHAFACYRLGRFYAAGRACAQNDKKAIELYKRSCKLGADLGCEAASKALGSGKEAQRFHDIACQIAGGCEYIGN